MSLRAYNIKCRWYIQLLIMFLQSQEPQKQFHTLFWAEIFILVEILEDRNWYRTLHMSVHKKNNTYHIISLKGHDLMSNPFSSWNFQLIWLCYLHNHYCNNNITSPNIHLKFTKKIPSLCNVQTLDFYHHHKKCDECQIMPMFSLWNCLSHKHLKSSIFVDKIHNLKKRESHK